MPTGAYWRKRMEALEQRRHNKTEEYLQMAGKQFRKAQAEIEKEIAIWYERLSENNEISLTAAYRLLRKDELEEFHWTVEEYIKKGETLKYSDDWKAQLENASAKVHIKRLEALKLQIQQQCELLYGSLNESTERMLRNIYKDQYYRTAFEIQKGTGVGYAFNRLDTRRVQNAIDMAWARDGKNFSSRIWQDKERTVNSLNEVLTQSIIRGENPRKAIERLAKKMDTSKSNAGRLYMTESAAIASRGQQQCYRELGVEEFEFVCTLDSHTSEICRRMDGMHFPMSQYEIGVTAPPMHPYCRSVTVPYFPDDEAVGKRAARGEDGKTYYVPADMTYEEWQRTFVEKEEQYDKAVELGSIDVTDKEKIISTLRAYEKKIVDSPTENAIIITKDGEIIQCFGTLNSVSPDVDLGKRLIGGYITHNHPVGSDNEYSFSKKDINMFMDCKLEVLRGVDEKFVYELTRNPEELDEHMAIADWDEYSSRHDEVISMAERLKIGYRRHRRE